ncbi:hypothetical protein FBU30_000777 [Linnemannia zychae]|nr:hypothetical protein FBU30_000777 [Linnemannia zychae]
MSMVSPQHEMPPAINRENKPKRSVSFMHHAVVTDIDDASCPTTTNNTASTMVPTGAPGNVNRSSFRPGRRPGYVRKGPVQSDSDDDESELDDQNDEDEDDHGRNNGISSFRNTNTYTTHQQNPSATTVRPGQNYVRRAPVNSDTESDEEKNDEPTRLTAVISTPPQLPTLQLGTESFTLGITNKPDEDNSDTDEETKKSGVAALLRPMAQTKISGPGQNYVRKAPVNSDSEDSDDEQSNPKVAPTPQQQQPPHSGGSIQNRHLNTALGATAIAGGSVPHSRNASFDPHAATSTGGVLTSAVSSPRSGPVATTSSPIPYNPYTPPSSLGMTSNNASSTSLSNLSIHSNSSNPHLASSTSSTAAAAAAANIASSMAIYQQQQQEMMMIMQQQQLQIATMQQQQQAYQLLVIQQQQQHQQQLQAVHQLHSRAASANGSIHTVDAKAVVASNSDSDDDVPLGEKQQHLPQLPHLPALPQFSSLLSSSSPPATPATGPTITPASPKSYSPHLSVQQSPLLQHNRQLSTSSIHSINNNGTYLHQPISSSPLNPATSSAAAVAAAAAAASSMLGNGVYGGGLSHQQTGSQPRLSDFIEEEQERLLREQHLHATALALGGHTPPASSHNSGASLLTSSFPAGYRGSVASVMSMQQSSGIDRGSMTSLHSVGSNGSGGSSGSNGSSGGLAGHRPSPSRDSFLPQMATIPLLQQQQYLVQQHQQHHMQQSHLLPQQPHYMPYQPTTLIHVEAKPPPPSAGLVGAISAMERDKKLAKAHGTNQLQYQLQQQQHQQMMNQEKERWLQEQRRLAWEAGQYPQQQQQMFYQQQQMQPGMMMMQMPMQQQQQQPVWTVSDEEEDDRPLGAATTAH